MNIIKNVFNTIACIIFYNLLKTYDLLKTIQKYCLRLVSSVKNTWSIYIQDS